MRLISQINGDGDILEAWLRYYLALGVTDFHVVVHGSRAENPVLFDLVGRYPVHVEDQYEGEFLDTDKLRRLNLVLESLGAGWCLCADSDEFLELPHGGLAETVAALERSGSDALFAPFLQRITADGSLDTPDRLADPFAAFPLCSVDLYRRMGVDAAHKKYPLFRCGPGTRLADGGNHRPPIGTSSPGPLRGALHHFKWRSPVHRRLKARIESTHRCREESQGFAAYLAAHDLRLPVEGAFAYSRDELFRRGLLRAHPAWQHAVRRALGMKLTAGA